MGLSLLVQAVEKSNNSLPLSYGLNQRSPLVIKLLQLTKEAAQFSLILFLLGF